MINTFIVDDSDSIVKIIKKIIEDNYPQLNVLGDAASVDDATELICKLKPSLIFFDIEIIGGTSFDVLANLKAKGFLDFEIIFISAHEDFKYVSKALKFSAIEYLTKPIDIELFQSATNKAIDKIGANNQANDLSVLLSNFLSNSNKIDKIALHMIKGVIKFIELERILYFEADGKMCYVYLIDGSKITCVKNIGYYKQLLQSDTNFFQISNALLINLKYLRSYTHSSKEVLIQNEIKLVASKNGGMELRAFLNQSSSEVNNSNFVTNAIKNILKR